MVSKLVAPLLGSLVLFVPFPTAAQPPASNPSAGQQSAPGLRKLTGDDEKRAKQLYEQIDKATKADRWEEAIARAEELLALRTRIQGPKHFETVDAEWALKALHRLAAAPNEDRVAYRLTRTMIQEAESLFIKGKYAAAQPLLEKALEFDRRLFADDHPETAASYAWVAANLKAQGKYAQAQPLFEKAMEICRRLLTDDHPSTATSLNRVADNLSAQGKYTQAQPLTEKALEIHRRLLTEDDPETAVSFDNLAQTFYAQGKYAQAQPLFQKALDIRRRLLTDDHHDTAGSFNNMAANLNAQGKYAQAQPLLEKALAIDRRLLTDDHPGIATIYNNLAYTLKAQGKYAQAQALFEKALSIRRRLLTDDHPDTAISFNNVAASLFAQGKYAEAQPLYEKALEFRRRRLTDDHRDVAIGYENLAANLNAQGRYAEAQQLLEKAMAILRRLLIDEQLLNVTSNSVLASNLTAQGKYREARDRLVSAVKSQDAARLRAAFTGLERAAGTKEPVRPALAAVLARLGQPAEAWQRLEEDLGRGLLDELAARQDRRLTPGERARLRELTTELERLDKLAETTPKNLDHGERAKRFQDLKGRRELASIALGEFQTKLVADHGALAGEVAKLSQIQGALAADAALVAWVDIRPVGPNAADPDGDHWSVVVRSRGIPCWVPLAGTGPNGLWTTDDDGLAIRVRMALRSRPGDRSADSRSLMEKLRALRIEPLATALGATSEGLPPARRLIVLPSRAMTGIPVEALLAADDSRTVSYAPSGTVFKHLREQPRPDRHAGLLALGDPIYKRDLAPAKLGVTIDPRPAPVAIAEQRKLQHLLVAARSGDDDFAPLPGTRHEALALASLFQSDDRPTMALFGADASEPELDRLAASGDLARFGFIHLATHGVIDEALPQRSAVILTQTGLPDPLEQVMNHKPVFDGRLSVREIKRSWDLKAELVTLSACATALGRDAGGEGFVGFTQALLMSGARSVCLSLWKVDDKATSLLMTRFYPNLLGKRAGLAKPMPKAEALREAKGWLRSLTVDQIDREVATMERGNVRPLVKDSGTAAGGGPSAPKITSQRPYDHPYYWAAFVLVGDPD